ncbi:hypothetical protein GCM10010218_42460 [Streptomyces mashuensis]|uniref:Uncharacterized protein n=1 Tax=Streptomyces mashuensis TaxID=33904 RepID=A0A919B6V1_9ACTN|nr:hypothetical protein [Streptomyces mashuensis]GHF56632.1 hypothetical protein GCM10010218_42460 [Streptomyces mashuensis]
MTFQPDDVLRLMRRLESMENLHVVLNADVTGLAPGAAREAVRERAARIEEAVRVPGAVRPVDTEFSLDPASGRDGAPLLCAFVLECTGRDADDPQQRHAVLTAAAGALGGDADWEPADELPTPSGPCLTTSWAPPGPPAAGPGITGMRLSVGPWRAIHALGNTRSCS